MEILLKEGKKLLKKQISTKTQEKNRIRNKNLRLEKKRKLDEYQQLLEERDTLAK
jgi:hypothetical protein